MALNMEFRRNYQSMREVLLDCISDKPWLCIFISAIVVFLIIQKVGEYMHSRLLSEKKRRLVSAVEFGSYAQSIFHATLTFTGSAAYLSQSLIFSIYVTEEPYLDSLFYRVVTVFSAGYYAQLLWYEMWIPQSAAFRVVMAVHHIFSGLCQAPVFLIGGSLQMLSALSFQCEISNIFMQFSWFAKQFENEGLFRTMGFGILLTYPITRCVILPIGIYYTWELCSGMIPEHFIWFAFVGLCFVFVMSIGYSFHILVNPKVVLVLNPKSEQKEKSE